jgi:hypothetical protein
MAKVKYSQLYVAIFKLSVMHARTCLKGGLLHGDELMRSFTRCSQSSFKQIFWVLLQKDTFGFFRRNYHCIVSVSRSFVVLNSAVDELYYIMRR